MGSSGVHKIGMSLGYVDDLQSALDKAKEFRFVFICCKPNDDSTERQSQDCGTSDVVTEPAFPWCCTGVESAQVIDGVVAVASHIGPDLRNGNVLTRTAEKLLHKEFDFYRYLGVPAIQIELSPEGGIPQLAHIVLSILNANGRNHKPYFWAKMELGSNSGMRCDGANNVKKIESLQMWTSFKIMCDEHMNVFPILELTKNLPSEEEMELWVLEHVVAILISTDVFVTNTGGHPILSHNHETILRRFLTAGTPQIVIHLGEAPKVGLKFYRRYVQYVINSTKFDKSDSDIQRRGVIGQVQRMAASNAP